MDSFIVAVLTVWSSITKLVEVNALPCAYALYVIEGTFQHHFPRTYKKTNKQNRTNKVNERCEGVFVNTLLSMIVL